jgi:hypothetical protein
MGHLRKVKGEHRSRGEGERKEKTTNVNDAKRRGKKDREGQQNRTRTGQKMQFRHEIGAGDWSGGSCEDHYDLGEQDRESKRGVCMCCFVKEKGFGVAGEEGRVERSQYQREEACTHFAKRDPVWQSTPKKKMRTVLGLGSHSPAALGFFLRRCVL